MRDSRQQSRQRAWRSTATALRNSPGLVRLTGVRFASQFGDGLFQAALGGAILFNPERHTDPVTIAAGFAVLLLPYSVIGPFAGALLDRWDRRLVLVWANLLRGVFIAAAAAVLLLGGPQTPLMLFALAAVGVSRFVLAGVSSSFPHVVAQSWLVPVNSVMATVGSGVSAVGAATAVATIGFVGAGDTGSGTAVLLGVSGSLVGAIAAAGFAANALGPEGIRPRAVVRTVLSGLRTGAGAVLEAPGATIAMLGIGAHRIVFGIDTLIMVLVLRAAGDDSGAPAGENDSDLLGGFSGFGVAVACTAAGMLLAAVLAPILIPRLGRPRTVTVGLTAAAIVQFAFVTTVSAGPLLVAAFLLGLAGQTIKLTGDAAMQIDIDDARRGRVFALQDTVFNIAFLGAIVVAAFVIDPDGRTPELAVAGGVVYLIGLVAVLAVRRTRQ
ncbi:MFS transporter [Rhodococcus rhodochrous]|uniref:MFS transporter n=1 Tax=Rhodococcus rhodochrous TaxID=1829 RepID=UPI001E2BD100|nr:MFS transporter [Rhodococcus rhodochrous]MCD2097671.1 MFS transporter [Rhodococcus rhodochrous]MCD2122028.1 MFS transporter [Rhodococcus rhodochrous]MCQ4135041.1 MFS transporter [Rhodococcus rhodochrous]MDJ0018892.1 MFS transporter [Rhodococcus rhodochrous]